MNKIITIRNNKVIIDRDLAELCQVKTKVLNQSVKRYIKRFSETDRFQLNNEELFELVTTCDRFQNLKHSTNPPFAFTKTGMKIVAEILKKDIPSESIFNELEDAILILQNADLRSKIHDIRGLQVMFDYDLAYLYDVKPTRLREQVKRNPKRFPKDFMYQLTEDEIDCMVSQNAIPSKSVFGGSKPYVFTEQGIASLSSVLTSDKAIEVHIEIMRAFVQMRNFLLNNANLFQRLGNIEQKLMSQDLKNLKFDKNFEDIFNAIEANELKPKEGIFYNEQVHDAYLFVNNLIKSANKNIVLIDNYIDNSVLIMFADRNKHCKVTIYTKNISDKLKLDLEKYNAQYPKIKIKQFNKAHDRFMIIDDVTVYHIGASLKDLGKKWFAFSKMNIKAMEMISMLNNKNRDNHDN